MAQTNIQTQGTPHLGQDFLAIVNRLALEADRFSLKYRAGARRELVKILMALRFITVVLVLALILNGGVTYWTADPQTLGVRTNSPIHSAVWYFCITLWALGAIAYYCVLGRVSILAVVLGGIEQVAIAAPRLVGKTFSLIFPDAFEKLFGPKGEFLRPLADAQQEKRLWQVSKDVLTSYLGGVAWILCVGYVLLRIPYALGYAQVALGIIGILGLIAALNGWPSSPWWLEKLQWGFKSFVGWDVFFNLVLWGLARLVFGKYLYNLDGSLSPLGVKVDEWWWPVGVTIALIVALIYLSKGSTGARSVSKVSTGYSGLVKAAAVIGVVALLGWAAYSMVHASNSQYNPSSGGPSYGTCTVVQERPNLYVVTVGANHEPLCDTGIETADKTITIRRRSGMWNSVNDRNDQNGQGLGQYPGTVASNAGIGALIANIGGEYFPVGIGTTLKSAGGKLLTGINDVPGKYGDNHGQLVLEVAVN